MTRKESDALKSRKGNEVPDAWALWAVGVVMIFVILLSVRGSAKGEKETYTEEREERTYVVLDRKIEGLRSLYIYSHLYCWLVS